MTESDEAAPRRSDPWTQAAVIAVLALCGFQVWWGLRMKGEIAQVRAAAMRMEEAAARPGAAAAAGDTAAMLEHVQGDIAVLTDEVALVSKKIDDLTRSLEQREGVPEAPHQPPDLDWTQPDLFELARRSADTVGIALTKDEVRVPARLGVREGPLEYFAVLKGGKEHETLLSLVGNTLPDARRPKDFGAKLNNAIQALGFKRGKPIKFTAAGTRPAQGERVALYVEWKTGGKTELMRAEDLVWNRVANRPMTPGVWVYVGSSFVPGAEPGTTEFAADWTAEAVATYSAPNTIIDNVEEGAQDDTVFVAATPRIPEDASDVVLVIRRTPLAEADVKTFPPVPGAGGR